MKNDAFMIMIPGDGVYQRIGCNFYKMIEDSALPEMIFNQIKPHKYFEAYTRMKNEEGKKYAKLNS